MTIFFYIAAFFLFAIMQSLFINGLQTAMDGKEKLDKHGNLKPEGDILYFIKRELTKGTKKRELLMGGSMFKVIKYIETKYLKSFTDSIVMFGNVPAIQYDLNGDQTNLKGFLQTIQLNEGIKYGPLEDWLIPESKAKGMGYYVLYAEKTKYKYNNWIRKSWGLACIKCAASAYGPLTLLPVLVYLFGIRWELVPVAIFDIGILVFMNYIFYKSV